MSRIGKQIISIPTNVEMSYKDGVLVVKGPRGELRRVLRPEVDVEVNDGTCRFILKEDSPFAHALWGTYAAHAKNMIKGVTEGFKKTLVVEGVGYRVSVEGNEIVLSVGFSHPVRLRIPEGITATSEKNTITVEGIDIERVGGFAAKIKSIKKPEPYKGKGIRYENEMIRRKVGKKAVA